MLVFQQQSSKEPLNKSPTTDGGSFSPTLRFEKREIHRVFRLFPNLDLTKNLSPSAAADLIRRSLKVQSRSPPPPAAASRPTSKPETTITARAPAPAETSEASPSEDTYKSPLCQSTRRIPCPCLRLCGKFAHKKKPRRSSPRPFADSYVISVPKA